MYIYIYIYPLRPRFRFAKSKLNPLQKTSRKSNNSCVFELPEAILEQRAFGLNTHMYKIVYSHYNKCLFALIRRPIGHQIAKPTCPAIKWFLSKGKLWFGLALLLCKCFDHRCHFWSWCASCRLPTRGQWGKHYKHEPA